MDKENARLPVESLFYKNLPSQFVMAENAVEWLLLREYGSVFVAKGVIAPRTVVFTGDVDVLAYQAALSKMSAKIGLSDLELQAPAMESLLGCIADADSQHLTITPRGADSARRSYIETVDLWKSRVHPALAHWTKEGNLSIMEAERILALSPFEQVPEIFKLEAEGMWFAKDLSKSIIYSVAPPGTSQHLSMLALDIKEHEDEKVRVIMAGGYWYQTVTSDLPHFTYLGAAESDLDGFGLNRVTDNGRPFWIPDI